MTQADEDRARFHELRSQRGREVAIAAALVDRLAQTRPKSRKARRLREFIDGHVARVRIIDEELLGLDEALRPTPKPYVIVPDWRNVKRATDVIARRVHLDPGSLAAADLMKAYVRDTFDALGLRISDHETLYVALVTSGLLVEMAHNGLRKGQTDEQTVATMALVAQSFAAALLDYLPPEAR